MPPFYFKEVVMIELSVFYVHILAALYGFTKRWQAANVWEGMLAGLIFGLVFIIMWSITGQAAKLLVPQQGYATWFTRDTMSLLLVAIPDFIFFYIFFLREKSSAKNPHI